MSGLRAGLPAGFPTGRATERAAAISVLVWMCALAWPASSSLAQEERRPSAGRESPAAGLTVRVRSESGEPVRKAEIRLEPADSSAAADELGVAAFAPSAPEVAVVEVAAGRYEIAAVPPGRYRLTVRALGYEPDERELEVGKDAVSLEAVMRVRPLPVADLVAAVGVGDGTLIPGHATSRIPLDGGPRTLADRLAEEPGVQVRRTAGGRQVGAVRGSRPDGLLVLLDGMPINDPLSGSADLSRIPVATLSDAVLVRGASPRFGAGAIAGVLLLESKRAAGTSAAGGAEVGSYGRLAADGYVSVGGETGTVAIGFRAEGIDNDFEYANRVLPGAPVEVRENADEEGLHLWLSGAPSAVPVFAQLRYDDVERGAPGRMGTRIFNDARYGDRSLQGLVGWGSAVGRAGASVLRRDLVYRDPRRRLESRQSLTGLRLAGSSWIPRIALEVSGYLLRESVAGSETADATRWSGGVWMGRTFHAGRVAVQPGLATDLSTDGNALNPEVALAAQLGPDWRLWGRAGRAYRLPTFADLYAPSARGIQANPDLQPERVELDLEAGASWSPVDGRGDGADAAGLTGWEVQATAFFRRTDDPIVWVASSVALWSPQNLDRLTAAGIELRADVALGASGPRAGGSLTLQRSRLGFGDNTNPMPYQPDVAGDLYVGGTVAGFWLRGAVQIEGSRTTSLSAVRRLPPHALARLDASRGFRLGAVEVEAALAIDNLFDARYEQIELFPEPGRSLLFRLEVRR